MRRTCLEMIHALAKEDGRIFFIGSDLGIGTLDQFKREMPDRFFMEGISEANLVGLAAGLAMEGKIVYLNTIATFITRRCFEQVALDLCLHQANVRLIGSGGGLVYAPLGPTHQATEDLAIFRALPNMTVLAPADAQQMRQIMPLTVNYPGPIYIRLAKGGDAVVSQPGGPVEIGKAVLMREGSDALLVTTGITLQIALQAAALLEPKGVQAAVLHVPTLKPLDVAHVRGCCRRVPVIVTLEEHSIIGGLGSAVAEVLAESDFAGPKRFRRLGIPDMFPDQYGSQSSLMARFGLTPEGVCGVLEELSAGRSGRNGHAVSQHF